jgi:arginyl-tRNA synthetase
LAKPSKINPSKVAILIKRNMEKIPKEITEIQVKGPYINFFLNKNLLSLGVLQDILQNGENYGRIITGKNKKQTIMIEFSQPNTHKAFHVGHIRGTSIGESLSRIYEFLGFKVIRANYSGDTGMHVAKWLWCYLKYHKKQRPKNDEAWIASIYVDAVKKLAKNPKLQDEVDEINKDLENKDNKNLLRYWKKTRDLSIKSWKKIYNELNTFFDVHYFEGDLELKGKKVVEDLIKKGIAKKSEGAIIVDLSRFKMGIWVLLRKDGTILYPAKDLVLAHEKFKNYKLNSSLVVVGNEQDNYFKSLIKVLELMNFKNYENYKHLAFAMVRLPHGKMSSRTGDNILYSDFIKEIQKYASKEIKKRSPKIIKKELEKRALAISIAAIKYSILKQGSSKNIVFNKSEALSFEGDTGPYLLYSYARASSILRKAKANHIEIPSPEDIKSEIKVQEAELIKKLSEFPQVTFRSYENLNPSYIANYSYQLAKLFNEFYHACPVINNENSSFRLAIVESFRIVLKQSLFLLGIRVLEKM